MHCAIGTYWSAVIGRARLYAYQCYRGRGGFIRLDYDEEGGRIKLTSRAVTIAQGTIIVNRPITDGHSNGKA